jgi:hypothetical protein
MSICTYFEPWPNQQLPIDFSTCLPREMSQTRIIIAIFLLVSWSTVQKPFSDFPSGVVLAYCTLVLHVLGVVFLRWNSEWLSIELILCSILGDQTVKTIFRNLQVIMYPYQFTGKSTSSGVNVLRDDSSVGVRVEHHSQLLQPLLQSSCDQDYTLVAALFHNVGTNRQLQYPW